MGKKSKEQKKAEREAQVHSVLVNFEKHYGHDDTKLHIWQTLCRDVGVLEGTSITQCKKNLRGVYVNIFDFITAKEAGVIAPRCTSLQDLRQYSWRNHKIFPLARAKENILLKGLLVQMIPRQR